jgi:hypothetical protein
MEVNYFDTLNMTRAFAPLLGANGGGYIVNVLSVAGAFPAPFMGGYSPAKAAALFLSSITRSELADQGTEVIALIVGSVDTRMAGHVQGRKEDPRDIVRAGLDALDRGEHVADTDFMAIDARARYTYVSARPRSRRATRSPAGWPGRLRLGLGAVHAPVRRWTGERARHEYGVRRRRGGQAMGHDIIQLHPLDVASSREPRRVLPRDGWFWDDLPGPRRRSAPRTAKTDIRPPVPTWRSWPRDQPPKRTLSRVIGIRPRWRRRTARRSRSAAGRSGSCPGAGRDRHRRRARHRERDRPAGRAVPHHDHFRLNSRIS